MRPLGSSRNPEPNEGFQTQLSPFEHSHVLHELSRTHEKRINSADGSAGTKDHIRMCLITASDGPRIMLFGPLEVDFLPLKQCILGLCECGAAIQLERQPFIVSLDEVALTAKCATTGSQDRLCLVRDKQGTSRFEWTLSGDNCDFIAEMIDALMEINKPAHQYLTNYPKDAAAVVLSKGEYSDETFNANS